MDAKIKDLKSKTKLLVKKENSLLKEDKKRDVVVDKAKAIVKHPSKKKHHKS